MRVVILAFLMAGCTTTSSKYPNFSTAHAYLDQAEEASSGKALDAIKKAKDQLAGAEKACVTNTQLLDQAVKDLNEQTGKVEYWKAKQRKALKELWIYRGALIALGLFAFRGVIFGAIGFIARKFIGVPW